MVVVLFVCFVKLSVVGKTLLCCLSGLLVGKTPVLLFKLSVVSKPLFCCLNCVVVGKTPVLLFQLCVGW